MLIIIGRPNRFFQNRRGLSNLIIVVLSLVILVVIVSNVILWSYQMNQLDWEKMQEDITITDVTLATRSSWFTVQGEYMLNKGSRIGGSYRDTLVSDGSLESFKESVPLGELDINGTFSIDLSVCPLIYIQSVEMQLRYRVDDTWERWFLKAYDWTSLTYSDNGFNYTAGHLPILGWNYYTVNLTSDWRHYVRNDGQMFVKVHDQMADSTRTNIDIDFLAVRAVINGTGFIFQNKGAQTAHFVSIWINNSTAHMRHDADAFVNSGETFSYQRADIQLPSTKYVIKAVTERGNIAVYAAG